ncbi:olfactory receptor 11A1-like [Erpetoichthys calabaricus]|uniref:olfactory receptor 11A1-like n=1 Tax=Erpetoichthys calabaricus TaxID=27687 RepID=UPI002234B0C8|nr:olfactory receptor 11A1-like [Erpetoichthys calabaricus]
MENTSQSTSLKLVAYVELNYLRYLYFAIVFMLYATIIIINAIIIGIVCTDKSLHEPMYIFLINLLINDVVGGTSLCPSILVYLLSNSSEISREYCLVQIFWLYVYGGCEFVMLAVIGYDRHLSICYPLYYNSIMHSRRVSNLIVFSWIFPLSLVSISVTLASQVQLCGNTIENIYCDNYCLNKIACSDMTHIITFDTLLIFLISVPQIFLLLYSYAKILQICLRASRESQKRALSTCMPHLVTLLNYFIGVIFQIIQSRFNLTQVPTVIHSIFSVYFLIIPPLLNPVVYGLKMQQIKLRIIKILMDK